jgi:hypothetical protein
VPCSGCLPNDTSPHYAIVISLYRELRLMFRLGTSQWMELSLSKWTRLTRDDAASLRHPRGFTCDPVKSIVAAIVGALCKSTQTPLLSRILNSVFRTFNKRLSAVLLCRQKRRTTAGLSFAANFRPFFHDILKCQTMIEPRRTSPAAFQQWPRTLLCPSML